MTSAPSGAITGHRSPEEAGPLGLGGPDLLGSICLVLEGWTCWSSPAVSAGLGLFLREGGQRGM